MIKLYDRIKEISYTNGTGNIALSGAVVGFSTFSSVYSNNDPLFYSITDGTNYEIGSGLYISSSNTIQRFPVKSTNNNQLVNFTEGLKEIYVNYPATNAIFNTSGINPRPENSGLAFWTSSNSLSYSNKIVFDSGNGRIGMNQSSPLFSIHVGGLNPNSIIAASGFVTGNSGIYFPSGNGDLSSYSGGRQLFHFEKNQLGTYASQILQLSGIVNQHILLKKQNVNTVFAGPSGACSPPCDPDYPTFRALVKEDIPNLSSLYANESDLGTLSGILTNVSGYLDNKISTYTFNFNDICNGRLSIVSGNPMAEGSSGILYFVPYNGNLISLYNGSSWNTITFNSTVAANTTTLLAEGIDPSNKIFDIFAYNNNGNLAFETAVWSTTTTRLVSLSLKDGIYVKSNDFTRRYIGSAMPVTTSFLPPIRFYNQNNYRYIYNHYNKIPMLCQSSHRGPIPYSWTRSSASQFSPIPNTFIAPFNSYAINILCGIQEDSIDVNASVGCISSQIANSKYLFTINSSRINNSQINNSYVVFSEPTSYSIGVFKADSIDNIETQIYGSIIHQAPIGTGTYSCVEMVPIGLNTPNLRRDYTNSISALWRC